MNREEWELKHNIQEWELKHNIEWETILKKEISTLKEEVNDLNENLQKELVENESLQKKYVFALLKSLKYANERDHLEKKLIKIQDPSIWTGVSSSDEDTYLWRWRRWSKAKEMLNKQDEDDILKVRDSSCWNYNSS